jgi:hypothetical protein
VPVALGRAGEAALVVGCADRRARCRRCELLAIVDCITCGLRSCCNKLDELSQPASLIEIANPARERVESLFCCRRKRVDCTKAGTQEIQRGECVYRLSSADPFGIRFELPVRRGFAIARCSLNAQFARSHSPRRAQQSDRVLRCDFEDDRLSALTRSSFGLVQPAG